MKLIKEVTSLFALHETCLASPVERALRGEVPLWSFYKESEGGKSKSLNGSLQSYFVSSGVGDRWRFGAWGESLPSPFLIA